MLRSARSPFRSPGAVLIALAAAALVAACSAPGKPRLEPQAIGDQGTLVGWQQCSDEGCGKNFIAAYSGFVFVRVDDETPGRAPVVALAPGRHWIEAHYSWGAGLLVGIGNWRNYGFELEVLPGHRYTISEVPAGCIVPATRHWVSRKVLSLVDQGPSGEPTKREVGAMAFCMPFAEETGTCRHDSDCRSGSCTPFGGTTGYGLCGSLRD